MPNHYFQFKQFTVWQEHVAMKVCTDACLYGAWLASQIQDQKGISNCLDIGTGTGLLSLILAQKTAAKIDGIELEPAAAQQAKENFAASPFANRLTLVQSDINQWQTEQRYQLVFSNPPFYEHDLASPDANRNLALHSSALTLEALFQAMHRLVESSGQISMILPYHRREAAINYALALGWHLNEEASIYQTEKHKAFRSFLLFSQTAKTPFAHEIIIKQNGVYSEAFTALLKDYYLAF
ncbi:MAG: methyltransferase [Chitinophagaceae bacterium BSSC1]|nr:MAG: methyltransferase [Chitinophagaceae bacterium BSSC1]